MKKIFLLITLFVSVSFLLKAQIPNPSFENWDTINNYCNGWYSLNDAFGASNTTRESISTDGNYSIGLQSVNIPGFGIAPGLATTGELNTLTKIKKVTSGSTPEIADVVDELYKSIIIAGTHKAPSLKVAEASKANAPPG